MANTKSAKKKTRVIARRTKINQHRRSMMRGFIRKVEEAITGGDRNAALAALKAAEPQIMNIYRRFGLNDRQIEIISQAIPKRDYYCQSSQGNRLFDLGLNEVALAFCAASSKADQRAISQIITEHGTHNFGQHWLLHLGLGWAAELLARKITPEL